MEAMDTTNFDDLLQQAEQLATEIDGQHDLPRVERNLKQLAEAGQQLWSRTALRSAKDSSDVKASVLLGSKGYDLSKVTQKLETLSSFTEFGAPATQGKDTDIQGFLKTERENAILSVIEDVKTSTVESVDKLFWNNLEKEWEDEKLKILNALLGPNKEFSELDISIDDVNKSQVSPDSFRHSRTKLYYDTSFIDRNTISPMDSAEILYANETLRYVDHLVQNGTKYPIAENYLTKISKEIGEPAVIELWEAICFLTKGIQKNPSEEVVPYRMSSPFQAILIERSRLFLEKKYREFIEASVYGEPKGGQLASYNMMKNYLNSRAPSWLSTSSLGGPPQMLSSEDGLVDGHPIWYFIWHSLRGGAIDVAIQVVQKGPVSNSLIEFTNYLKEYKQNSDHRLSQKSENQIRLLYKRSIRSSPDPYKRAVYSLLGCCDVNGDHSDVIDKIEDLLWLRLCQVKISEPDAKDVSSLSIISPTTPSISSDKITLNKLQHFISEEYGESHFDAHQHPFTYFKLLFLSGQFETSIEFLSRIEKLRCHAVHIAIALNELSLLILPPQHLNVPVLSKQQGIKRLNVSRLIMIYVRKFETTNPTEAIYYFYLLRNIKCNDITENLFLAAVSRLVRETKDFDKLLGYISDDGCQIPGVVDKFHHDVSSIISQIAVDCEKNGQFEEAVKLFDLGNNHEKALALLNKLLASVIPEIKSPDSKRERLEELALKLAERYCAKGHNASKETAGTFYHLLDLITFFDYYYGRNYNDALDTIESLKIIPFQSSEVEQKVQEFGQLAEEIKRNIPDILLATMNILYAQYKDIKIETPHAVSKFGVFGENTTKQQLLNDIRQKARILITFAGMISYKMPGDTNGRLVQLEVLMN